MATLIGMRGRELLSDSSSLNLLLAAAAAAEIVVVVGAAAAARLSGGRGVQLTPPNSKSDRGKEEKWG